VPIAGAEQMYQALRSLGVETPAGWSTRPYHGLTGASYQRVGSSGTSTGGGKYLPAGAKTTAGGH